MCRAGVEFVQQTGRRRWVRALEEIGAAHGVFVPVFSLTFALGLSNNNVCCRQLGRVEGIDDLTNREDAAEAGYWDVPSETLRRT